MCLDEDELLEQMIKDTEALALEEDMSTPEEPEEELITGGKDLCWGAVDHKIAEWNPPVTKIYLGNSEVMGEKTARIRSVYASGKWHCRILIELGGHVTDQEFFRGDGFF